MRGDWADAAPPSEGWTPVTLPDDWSRRWPEFEGVVWYRLRWTEPAAQPLAPRAVFIDYVNMAAAVSVNGSLIGRDARLVEPLSRAWNLPRLWVLDAPLLRPGTNELLVRVSGFARYQAGLSPVVIGPPAVVDALHGAATFERRSIQWLGLTLTLFMGITYGMLWLLRRTEAVYGWFAAFSLSWLPYSYNYIATDTWPLPGTDAFQRANIMALLLSVGFFVAFALSFCQVRRPRLQRAVAGLVLAVEVLLWLAPAGQPLAVARLVGVFGALGLFVMSAAMVALHAWRTRAADATVLALCLALPLVAGVHATLVLTGVLASNRYYITPTSIMTLLGISFVLTWRFVQGMRLVENFNTELQRRVDDATARLAELLGRQHAAELLQTRLGERLSLVRDLHDGLGMTLSGHISLLRSEAGRRDMRALHALEEVSADLRLIIESSALEEGDPLADRLAPLRHRTTRIFEAAGIDCRWTLHALDRCHLDSRRALDLLRLLQEALANALRHSQARRVEVLIDARGPDELTLAVVDDGRGLPPDGAGAPATGLGLGSMRARAERLRGTLAIASVDGGTVVRLRIPIDAATATSTAPA